MARKWTRRVPKHRYNRKRKRRAKEPRPMGLSTSMDVERYTPIARTLKTTMKYQTQFELNAGVLDPSVFVFSANGMFDPEISAVGHQPRGYDQIKLLYDHYVVIFATIEVTVHCNDTNNGNIAFIATVDTNSPQGTLENYMELPKLMYVVCGTQTSGSSIKTIRTSIPPNKFLGHSKPLSDDNVKGSANANPAEQVFFHVGYTSMVFGADPPPMAFNVIINYTAIWIEPKNPPAS